jgi:amino acid transporter
VWGSWFIITFGAVGAVLLLLAIAFGTSAALFPVLIAAVIGVFIAIFIGFRRSTEYAEQGRKMAGRPKPRSGGAPASGEGSGSPTSARGVPPT